MVRFEGFVSKFYCKCIFDGLYDFKFFFSFFIGKLRFFFFSLVLSNEGCSFKGARRFFLW